MRLRTAIPAGLADTGATALASFVVQAYAVRTYEADVLGVYALFFAAYILASLTPQFLFLYPLEIRSLELARPKRIGLLHRSFKLTAVTPVVAGLGALLAWQLNTAEVDGSTVVRLALTSAALGMIAPFYEHLKRMMHISELSAYASATALIQLILVVVSLIAMLVADVDPSLIPFGSLALSQLAASIVGLTLVRHKLARIELAASLAELVHSGRWLLVSGLVPAAATLGAAGLVSSIAGADALGLAQAAHLASRPVLVLAAGLSAVLAFRLMEAGADGDSKSGLRHWKIYGAILIAGGVAYAAVAAFDWVGNPVAALLPRAYEVGGLVAVALVANLLFALARPPREELIGGRKEPWVASIDSFGATAVVVVAGFAGTLDSFAVPLGVLAAALIHGVGYVLARRVHYRQPASASQPTGG